MRTFLFILFTLSILNSEAQPFGNTTKTVFIDNIDSVCNNLLVNFPVRAKNFNNITGIQGTIKWDSTVLKFDSLLLNTNTSVIKFYDTTTNLQLANGFLTFLWTDSNFVGVSIPDSSILFTLRLKVINAVNYTTPIYFSPSPTMLEIVAADSSFISYIVTDTAWQSGYIRFVDTPKIIQNGNTFTCVSSCVPLKYVWNIYDSVGALIKSDTTTTNTYTYISLTSNNNVTVVVIYTNGNRISSIRTPIKTLPLDLIIFTVKLQTPSMVLLKWQTANEVNIAHINIQRSTNNKDFITISKINAGKYRYEFVDFLNNNYAPNTYFYRLEIVDKDGSKSYSDVKKVILKNEKYKLNIYPNPTKNSVAINCLNATDIIVTDFLGKQIINKNIANNTTINTSYWAKGIYFIKILLRDGEVVCEKLVVE